MKDISGEVQSLLIGWALGIFTMMPPLFFGDESMVHVKKAVAACESIGREAVSFDVATVTCDNRARMPINPKNN